MVVHEIYGLFVRLLACLSVYNDMAVLSFACPFACAGLCR